MTHYPHLEQFGCARQIIDQFLVQLNQSNDISKAVEYMDDYQHSWIRFLSSAYYEIKMLETKSKTIDLLNSGNNVLFIAPFGAGKSTFARTLDSVITSRRVMQLDSIFLDEVIEEFLEVPELMVDFETADIFVLDEIGTCSPESWDKFLTILKPHQNYIALIPHQCYVYLINQGNTKTDIDVSKVFEKVTKVIVE